MGTPYRPYTPQSISYSYVNRYGQTITGTHYGSSDPTQPTL